VPTARSVADLAADAVIGGLGLQPHPEGGHYRETWRDRPPGGGRGAGTAILFLLGQGERSHWHRVDATEIWHFHAGAPLALSLSPDGKLVTEGVLGCDLAAGQLPQLIVPARVWQAARSLGGWTLVGCTVSPAFEFAGFELAPPGWRPLGARTDDVTR
jgi:predicted cupin superfamily sugar epimerase